jgi:hypothetical protein
MLHGSTDEMTTRFQITCFVCLLLLIYSSRPGSIATLMMPAIMLGFLTAPIWLICGALFLFLRLRRQPSPEIKARERTKRRFPKSYVILVALVFVLLLCRIPTRIALWTCSTGFGPLLRQPPVQPEAVEKSVGLFKVDRYAKDPRGGVYFRTATGADGIGPDTMSYGLAVRPNAEGSPFGNAYYDTYHLFGDWHTFEASNDW